MWSTFPNWGKYSRPFPLFSGKYSRPFPHYGDEPVHEGLKSTVPLGALPLPFAGDEDLLDARIVNAIEVDDASFAHSSSR
jgi:hypothetical protein